jgi:Cu/Zn superoxide dismutase
MVAAASCILVLTGCQSVQQIESHTLGTGPSMEGKLVPIGGSVITGAAILRAYDGGVTITVNFNGGLPGEYRIVVHATGNCTSSNGFSAGPPWAPPGVAVASPVAFKGNESASLVARLPGYRIDGTDGVQGRSAVVHAGAQGSLEAQPGVPNNRVACGVIGTPRSLFAPAS